MPNILVDVISSFASFVSKSGDLVRFTVAQSTRQWKNNRTRRVTKNSPQAIKLRATGW